MFSSCFCRERFIGGGHNLLRVLGGMMNSGLANDSFNPVDKVGNVCVHTRERLSGAADTPRDQTDEDGSAVLLCRQRPAGISLRKYQK